LMIRARHTHYKLIKFRALALELARTVPLGLMDDLKITRSDWLTMKQHMFRTISTKLAPLVSKLRPLMNAPWPGDTLGDEAKIQLGVEEAKEREWMRKEVYYPLWWEYPSNMTGSLNDSNSYQHIPNLQTAKHLNERVDSTRIVFRVFHSQSFRGYDPATGFVATGFDEKTSHHETRLAEAHLDCRNKDIVTPWISTSRRWLWAVWEMNRLFEGYSADSSTVWKRSNIRVAVIDLAACRGGSKAPVHALSVLGPAGNSKCRDFANMSDEILIYGKVPPAAIISVWKFEKSIKIMGMPPLIWTKVPTGYYKPYRDFYRTLVQALEDPLTQAWTAKEEGERCASIVISMMQDGYRRLEERIDRMIGSVRETRRWAQKNASS
ncbi:hypothetical protein FRC11_000610, partial [Ceratobasidium sp. 423]